MPKSDAMAFSLKCSIVLFINLVAGLGGQFSLFGQTLSVISGMEALPAWQGLQPADSDWLITPSEQKAGVYKSKDGKDVILDNGLVRRVFRITPNVACYDYTNLTNGQQLLRTISEEARVEIAGKSWHIGGLIAPSERGYFMPQWLDQLAIDSSAFRLVSVKVKPLQPFVSNSSARWRFPAPQKSGQELIFSFGRPDARTMEALTVDVHYEIYDGLPLIVKYISIHNHTSEPLTIGRVVNETLALVEEESAVVGKPEQMKKQHGLYIETNYAFNNAMRYDISDQTTHWSIDKAYTSQVNYNYETPCKVEVYPEKVISVELAPGASMVSVRSHELLMDSYDRERRGLFIRRMYRVIAPWTNENPIFMHLVSKTDEEVIQAIDQCAATGYEALILSFGSHLNMEDDSEANLQRWKRLADYAHERNIEIGGYSLFSSRRISDEDDVIDPVSGKPDAAAFFGHAPCMGSRWGLAYLQKLKRFFKETGFDLFENDGPYPGDVCASTTHPGHQGLGDSQWRQMALQKELYQWLNARGVYINAPDWYFLDGTHKIAIGYREVNFSLPRDNQKILNRQNIYDGTFEKNPSMGWGFVPLTKYQGGGPEAILEPLSEHLADYRQLMFQYYGAGVQACYRGPRLFDTEKTRLMVLDVIDWYKSYRDILNADIIHLRRPDGRDWDGIMHVHAGLKVKGFVLLYNPLPEKILRTISLPLYYTGLTSEATVKHKGIEAKKYRLARDFTIQVPVEIEAGGYTWFTIE